MNDLLHECDLLCIQRFVVDELGKCLHGSIVVQLCHFTHQQTKGCIPKLPCIVLFAAQLTGEDMFQLGVVALRKWNVLGQLVDGQRIAAVLFTTNCIMPLRESYADRIFTTSVVSYPEVTHIGADKDFTPVIRKALECGGYDEDKEMTGMNGGHKVITGFAHNAVLKHAEKIIQLIKAGKIRHIFLIGGCDGASPSRSYYSDFARLTPPDTLILTLACGKYRLNDMDLGDIDGIPRILDMGQCNDSYSAVRVASALAEAFGCGVNDLPLTLVLSWYEQKAVCILLSLLYLGLKNIILGPTIPAFVSPAVLEVLQNEFKLRAATTPEDDLRMILG